MKKEERKRINAIALGRQLSQLEAMVEVYQVDALVNGMPYKAEGILALRIEQYSSTLFDTQGQTECFSISVAKYLCNRRSLPLKRQVD